MTIEQNERVRTDLWKIATHVVNLEASIIREILKISNQPGIINFAGGLPAPELFPVKDMHAAMDRVFEKHGQTALQYSLSMGITELRELLAERATKRGTPTKVENILITCGAQQAIELVARAFIEPGDYILTENPTYLGALQAFNYYRAKYATVEMDAEGMIIDQVEETIKKYKPKLIYTVSNFQNPTGITMSKERREELVKLAISYHIPIIDDNPYGDIRFSGERVPTLKSIGGDEVIALRTFSKIMSPGMRVGWMNGPAEVLRIFEKVKQCVDLHTNSIGQYMIYEYVAAGLLEPHIKRICVDYKQKRDVMLEVMRETFPEGITWTEPDGGLFLWVRLPKHMSAKEIFPKAIEQKVAYVYGQPFFPGGEGENTLRLNFCNASVDKIREGTSRLATVLKDSM